MQNDNVKLKTDLKKRVYLYALDIIHFLDKLNQKDFTNFFSYSLKSANESKFWLGLIRDSNKADKNQANKLLDETKEIANILGASILTLKGKNKC